MFRAGHQGTRTMSYALVGSLVMAAALLSAGSVHAAGSSWTLQPTPSRSKHLSELLSVSCPSATACTAVGNTVGPDVPLAERWNGSTWSIQATPNPSGSGDTQLSGVSCPTSSDCVAVGWAGLAGSTTAIAEGWNGVKWTLQTVPLASGTSFSQLNGVSCASTSACTAVGTITSSSGDRVMIERWNGSSWTIQAAPGLPASADFLGSSCPSVTLCTAVGNYDGSSGDLQPLVARWSGTGWAMQNLPIPGGAVGGQLTSVSCSSNTMCMTVGLYTNSGLAKRYLADIWNGSTWSLEAIPDPTKSNLNQLNAVSCAAVSGCTAVGSSAGKKGTLTVAEGWNGSVWAVQTTVNPAPTRDYFDGVSCVPTATCTAVGTYQTASGMYDTLAEHKG